MGFNLTTGSLFCNGVKLGDISATTMSAPEISDENFIKCKLPKEITLTGTFLCKGMSRKRFVKLLMAQGYSRNQANNLASGSRYLGYPYAMSAIMFGV